VQLQDHFLILRRNLDVGRHIILWIQDHPFEWISVGFMLGWLLSRLPARKKKIYIYSPNQERVKGYGNKTKSKLWKVAWSTSKHRIAAYLAKKLAERAKAQSSGRECITH